MFPFCFLCPCLVSFVALFLFPCFAVCFLCILCANAFFAVGVTLGYFCPEHLVSSLVKDETLQGGPELSRPAALTVAAPVAASVIDLPRYVLEENGTHRTLIPARGPKQDFVFVLCRVWDIVHWIWVKFLRKTEVSVAPTATPLMHKIISSKSKVIMTPADTVWALADTSPGFQYPVGNN